MAEVQKSAFSLSGATLMVGRAFIDDVFSLTPDAHSVGMAQEIRVAVDSSRTELLNGVSQSVVASRRTNVKPMISANIFEYTAQNFLRAQGLTGTAVAPKRGQLTTAAAAAAVSLTVASDPIPGETTTAITALGDIPAGSSLLIQMADGTDYVFPTKSSGAATGTGPYTIPIAGNFAIPAGMSFPIGAKVWIVQEIGVGLIDEDDVFCVKISGTLANYNRPLTCVYPKVRVSKGFEIGFSETQYGSMPWEMEPQLMSKGEALSLPRLAEIGTRRAGLTWAGS